MNDLLNLDGLDTQRAALIEAACEAALAREMGFDVEVSITPEGLKIYGYPVRRGVIQRTQIEVTDLSRGVVARTIRAIQASLEDEATSRLYDRLRPLVGHNIRGEVFRQGHKQEAYALCEIDDTTIIGVAPYYQQILKEVGSYTRGRQYVFNIWSVSVKVEDGASRLLLVLSRTAPNALKRMLEDTERELDSTVRQYEVVKRYPGRYAFVTATSRVPLDVIKTVSREFCERIYIRF